MKADRAPMGLGMRIFLIFFVFTLAMLAILWLLETVFLDSIYREIRIREIQRAEKNLEVMPDDEAFYPTLVKAARSGNFCVIVAERNSVLYSVDVLPSCVIHRMSHYNVAYFSGLARNNGGEYLLRVSFDQEGGGEFRDRGITESIIYTKIVNRGGKELCLILNAEAEPITATVTTLRALLILVTVIFLLVSALLAAFLSRSLSRPLAVLTRKSRFLGHPDAPDFRTEGYREVAELGDTLENASRELSKNDRLQKELVANVSHDLRTPLTMIAGYAEMMRDIPGENTPENAGIILEESRRLSTIVTDALDVSRIQSGSEPIVPETFDLTRDTRDIVDRFSRLTEHEGYNIVCSIPEKEALVNADRMMISRVIYNLINNAVTHAGENRHVLVTEEIRPGAVRILVEDDGPGIPDRELDSIWDRYYKVDKSHARAAVGSGLGLSIVKTILSLHHATYGVESAVGAGSIFWFELPLVK